jgi:hypothetical protein
MKRSCTIFLAFAALFALYCLPMLPGVCPARAQWSQSDAAYEDPGGSAVKRFVKHHPVAAGAGVLAVIIGFFALIMGPSDLFDAVLRTRRDSRPLRDIERGLGQEGEVDRALDAIDDARRKDDNL